MTNRFWHQMPILLYTSMPIMVLSLLSPTSPPPSSSPTTADILPLRVNSNQLFARHLLCAFPRLYPSFSASFSIALLEATLHHKDHHNDITHKDGQLFISRRRWRKQTLESFAVQWHPKADSIALSLFQTSPPLVVTVVTTPAHANAARRRHQRCSASADNASCCKRFWSPRQFELSA